MTFGYYMIDFMLDILVLIGVGIIIGIAAGLLPGIHINTTIPFILSLSAFINDPLKISLLLVSVSMTEMFLDHISSIFLGCPDSDTAMCVLPGHRMLLEGRAYEAIKMTILGNIGSLILSIILVFLFVDFFQLLYEISRPFIKFVILSVILYMIASEREFSKIVFSIITISLSGLLGMIILNSSVVNQQNALLPALTGLFGMSGMLMSLSEDSKVPEQVKDSKILIGNWDIAKTLLMSSFAGILVGFLPAVGISESAVILQTLGGINSARSFLMMTSGINASNDMFSLVSLYLIGNPRSGASVAIQSLLGSPDSNETFLMISTMVAVSGISGLITLYLSRRIPDYVQMVDFRKLNLLVIAFLLSIVFLITGFNGLLILITSTSIGLISAYGGIRRSHCMGILMIPTLSFFLDLNPIIISILNI